MAKSPSSYYGEHFILDMVGCDATRFHRTFVKAFMKNACEIFNFTAGPLHFWGYADPAERAAAPKHLRGISAVQFIETSNVIIHCIDHLGRVMINVFACGPLQASHNQIRLDDFTAYARLFWRGRNAQELLIYRGGGHGYQTGPGHRYQECHED